MGSYFPRDHPKATQILRGFLLSIDVNSVSWSHISVEINLPLRPNEETCIPIPYGETFIASKVAGVCVLDMPSPHGTLCPRPPPPPVQAWTTFVCCSLTITFHTSVCGCRASWVGCVDRWGRKENMVLWVLFFFFLPTLKEHHLFLNRGPWKLAYGHLKVDHIGGRSKF